MEFEPYESRRQQFLIVPLSSGDDSGGATYAYECYRNGAIDGAEFDTVCSVDRSRFSGGKEWRSGYWAAPGVMQMHCHYCLELQYFPCNVPNANVSMAVGKSIKSSRFFSPHACVRQSASPEVVIGRI